MPAFCSSCGAQQQGNSRFCASCGAPSSGASAASSATSSGKSRGLATSGSSKASSAAAYTSGGAAAKTELSPIIEELKQLYRNKILPLEKDYKFDEFHSPHLTDTDFDAKPMVLLIGQYSTGKTTFIKYLLERDFPGAHIGPEPTTDRFVAVMHGRDERIIPGNALAADASRPFTALTKYGMAFLNKFECSQCDSPILDKISFIDTPGILSGEKQKLGRSYNFSQVIEWFAERADRILILFDAAKLDISDEFRGAIEALRGNEDKIKVVLNKADMPISQLTRVYGALMWSLGRVIKTPEVLRVYIGSFADIPLQHSENAKLLQQEQQDLLSDLRALPRNSTLRRINELVKRARMAKVHAHIIAHLRGQFGYFGKDKKQGKLLDDLGNEFRKVISLSALAPGDLPDVERFKAVLARYDISKFPKLDTKKAQHLDDCLSYDIPNLMRMLPGHDDYVASAAVHSARGAGGSAPQYTPHGTQQSTAMSGAMGEPENPFQANLDLAPVGAAWRIDRASKARYDGEFYSLELDSSNRVSGANAKRVLLKSGLPGGVLRSIWSLADVDVDGQLSSEEFAVAMHLIDLCKTQGEQALPATLPEDLVPPSMRKQEGR